MYVGFVLEVYNYVGGICCASLLVGVISYVSSGLVYMVTCCWDCGWIVLVGFVCWFLGFVFTVLLWVLCLWVYGFYFNSRLS